MSKYIKLLLTLFIATIPFHVYADCESDRAEYERIKDQFKITYKYNKDTDDFTVTEIIPQFEKFPGNWIQRMNEIKNSAYADDTTMYITYKNYKDNTFYRKIYINRCPGDNVVLDETINFVKYNRYYDDPRCEGNEDFVLCQKDYEKNIDEKTFESRLETYIAGKENKQNYNEQPNNSNDSNDIKDANTWENIKEYVEDNLIMIIVIAIFLLIIAITVILMVKSYIKSRRLE